MESRVSPAVPPTILLGLAEHLRLIGSKLSVEQAATLAISEWQAAHGQHAPPADANELHGYQWKSLFLPESSALRMIYGGESYYARVVGDHLIFQGRRVSPRKFTIMVTRNVRNAWRELWIRFPDSRDWKNAHACRVEHEKEKQLPVSPAETMNAAAARMSEALKAALKLIEHTNAQTVKQFERRLSPKRRDSDHIDDDCAFD